MTDSVEPIRVGIVGANPNRGWAFHAHIPAIAAVDQFEITAVATTREDSAKKAAQLTGARHWFSSPTELAQCEDVDLVVVAVRVSSHAPIIETAFDEGKHVFCEWPLAVSLVEAEALTKLTSTETRGFVGLQARMDPAVRKLRKLIREDGLGEILAVSGTATRAKGLNGVIDEWAAYTLDRSVGAGTCEVLGGHFLDLIDYVTGGISVTDVAATQSRHEYTVAGGSVRLIADTPDKLRANFSIGPGALGTAVMCDGSSDPGAILRVDGSAGSAILRAEKVEQVRDQQPQMAPYRLDIYRTDSRETFRTGCESGGPGAGARNVARVYGAIATDLTENSAIAATFDDALRVHRLLLPC